MFFVVFFAIFPRTKKSFLSDLPLRSEKFDKTVDEIEVVTEVGFCGRFLLDEFLLCFFSLP